MPDPLFRKVDAVQIIVPDLDAGLAFYCDQLGHELAWRSKTAAGLRMPDSNTDLVIQTALERSETDLLVESADDAATRFVEAGGSILVPAQDIPVGRAVVVRDPWGNRLVLLDLSKGMYVTDSDGNVIGVRKESDD